ncbi:hypothetical protein L6E12_17910 [Actinokineospora sp. PR83]|uniref:lipopolysaccharide biosynthesis protein n=1 Tax=Actinokineospora sp. PR83 TaxID=2884908 RepID=UPI001F23C5D4|nr:hypothetical protein [Actinokineospora sp. PR83]MCG8917662.1 hypothetical protein [Actinokineospora sp. PR83]
MARLKNLFGPAVLMAAGLGVVGVAGYGFIGLTGHTLPAADAAALASLYLLVNIIGPGLFVALEQETSRATSARLAVGGELRPVVRHALLHGLIMLVAVLALLGAISPVLTARALGGQWGLFAAVVLSVVTSAGVYLVRGLLGGRQRFHGYAATLGVEGIARLLPCAVIAVSGPDGVLYALAFAAGSGFGALAGLPGLRARTVVDVHLPGEGGRGGDPEASTFASMGRGLLLLVVGTLLMQLVANLAPIVVTSRLVSDPATAQAFASAFVLVRVPLFLFAPVQAMLLPGITRAATTGDTATVWARLRLVLLAVAGIGVPAAVLSFTVGPLAARLFFGAEVDLAGAVVGLLGVGTIALMVAQVLQPGLVAFGSHRYVTAAWVLGTVVLVGLLFLPGDPLRAAIAAQLAASVAVVAVMSVGLFRAIRGATRATPPAVAVGG